MKKPQNLDREWKLKWNCLKIEIEKCNFGPNDFHLVNFYFYQKCEFVMTKYKVTCTISLFFSREKGWNFCPFHSFREMKVKWKWLEIEIEKWKWNKNDSRSRSEISKKFSRILENRDSRRALPSSVITCDQLTYLWMEFLSLFHQTGAKWKLEMWKDISNKMCFGH